MTREGFQLYVNDVIKTRNNSEAEIVHIFKNHDAIRIRYLNGIFDSIGKKEVAEVIIQG